MPCPEKIKKNIAYSLKVSIAAVISIILANFLGLQFAVAAGIVTILSVAFTKKETLKTACNRFIAFVFALFIAKLCFSVAGFTNQAFFLYLVIFIVLCQFAGWNNAMAMDSVLISHFLSFQKMDFASVINEILLFVIGVGVGIGVNLFLHKNEDYMLQMKNETDSLIKTALHRMSLRIVTPDIPDYDGACFNGLRASIDRASDIARENYMNQLSKDTRDMQYIFMREKQVEILYEMFKHLSKIETTPISAKAMSDFWEKVSTEYSMENTVEELWREFEALDRHMKQLPLPTDRKEFEDRARLFAIMRGMEEFLLIKKQYMEDMQRKSNS